MNKSERRANTFRRLASQLKKDLVTAESLAQQVLSFAENVNETRVKNDPNIYAVALNLQHFYTCVETALKRIVDELEGNGPAGEAWHRVLLEQAAIEVEQVRPALIANDTRKKLDRLRRFRHIVRHGYEYNLEWKLMSPLVELVSELLQDVKRDMRKTITFLKTAAEELENSGL